MPRPSSPCCAASRCRAGSRGCSRPSRASTTRPVVLLVTALAASAGARRDAPPVVADRPRRGRRARRRRRSSGSRSAGCGARLLRLVATTSSALFAIGVMSVAVLAYAAADVVHASGFIACYLAALVLGNLRLPHRPAVDGFATAIGWLAQIGLFVLLGLLASPGGFARRARAGPRRRRRAPARSADRCRSSCRARRSGCRGAPRRSCRGRVCAERCPSCSRRCR